MADFIVQEEDGSSLIDLEDDTGSLLLEAAPPTPPSSDATWKVGVITVPGGTGSQAYTGLGGTPAAVFFFGANWTTEDTAVTTAHTGVFRGMASPRWDSPGTIVQNCASVHPGNSSGNLGYNIDNYAVNCLDTSFGVSHRASLTSFDADGFTLNWTTVNAGYKVVYVALMNVQNYGGGFTSGGVFNNSLGWKAGAMLMHGAWGGVSQQDFLFTRNMFGGAAYPGTFAPSWYAAGINVNTFPTSAFQQYDIGVYNFDPGTLIANSVSFIGPFLNPGNYTSTLSGGSLDVFNINSNESTNEAMFVAWDDEDSQTGRELPGQNTGDTVTVSGLPFAPGLVIGYTLSDEPPGQGSTAGGGTGSRGALGLSVATPTFQWSAIVDGTDRGSFQSFQRGFTDTVHNTNVHAGTVELTADGFILTTEEDDTTTHDWVWHAFGHPDRIVKWIPHIYRRVQG